MFSTYKEFESWIRQNAEKAIEYVKKNDFLLKEMQLSARTYNALRFNNKIYFSDIVLKSDDDIFNYEMMDKFSAQEIIMLKKNYLRKHKDNIVDFVINYNIISKNKYEVIATNQEKDKANEKRSKTQGTAIHASAAV